MDIGLGGPVLSAFDPIASSDVSIDPLGLGLVYERLADRMLPGITVRMRRPRFLTVMAIGAHLCEKYPEDALAADGVTPAYLVFEWCVVEAYVCAQESLADAGQIPGFGKVTATLKAGLQVCPASYLKTAATLGFSGIFRRLARRAHVLTTSGLLDESGHRLVQVGRKSRAWTASAAETPAMARISARACPVRSTRACVKARRARELPVSPRPWRDISIPASLDGASASCSPS
jgi:hypothetical protein